MKEFISIFSGGEPDDFRHLFTAVPNSFADKYPDVPKPEPRLSPKLLAARWTAHDLHGEDMPLIAADLLEAGYDSPSLRRLAGEMNIHCSADVEDIVARTFQELSVEYPMSESAARLFASRQIAREVIAGERNPWAAASHLEIVVWGWSRENSDIAALVDLLDELDWGTILRRQLPALSWELLDAFARLGALTSREKRAISFGGLAGKGWIAEDFDAPLPPEIQAAFEGSESEPV